MTHPVPTHEPSVLRAGDTWKWRREDLNGDWPAPSWTLKYRFKNQAGGFEITATASGVNFDVVVTAATTAAFVAGDYTWQAWVEGGASEVYTVGEGTLKVLASLRAGSAGTAQDLRSHARKVLDAIKAVLENRASLDQQSYQIHGRALSRTPIPDLLVLRDRYEEDVASEERAEKLRRRLGGDNRILVRG